MCVYVWLDDDNTGSGEFRDDTVPIAWEQRRSESLEHSHSISNLFFRDVLSLG